MSRTSHVTSRSLKNWIRLDLGNSRYEYFLLIFETCKKGIDEKSRQPYHCF